MARGAFWTIIVDDQPTAFRAPVREDLLPTLKQLQRQHPTAVIKWFQRGRLWETPGDAMDATKPPRRGDSWRPGGEHKDPREVYKVPRDVKRARWASQAAEGRGPWMKGTKPFGSAQGKPGSGYRGADGNAERGDRPAWKPKADRPAGDRPFKPREDRADYGPPKPRGEGGWKPKSDRPSGDRPFKPREDRPDYGPPKPRGEGGWKPKGDRPAFKPRADRPDGDRPAFKPRTERPEGDGGGFKPKGDRPAWKPSGPGIRRGAPSGAPRGDWRDRGARGDATPRSAGSAAPPAKRGKTWRVGELPPADRKKKKKDE
jgi:hypothetical protein